MRPFEFQIETINNTSNVKYILEISILSGHILVSIRIQLSRCNYKLYDKSTIPDIHLQKLNRGLISVAW